MNLTDIPTYGLILKLAWCQAILHEGKRWEIRGSDTKKRGRIVLISGQLGIGSIELVDTMPLTEELFNSSFNNHRIPNWGWVRNRYPKPHAWIMKAPLIYDPPLIINRKPGQVIWVKL